jgi:hypothetical protein
MDLVAIEMDAPDPMVSYGPDAFLGPGSCDCENNEVIDNCNIPASAWCAPFTGDGATVYQLAGQPPMTLYGSGCACP